MAPPMRAPAPVWPVALPMSAPFPAPMAPPPNTPRSVLDMDEQPQDSSTGRTATPRRRRVFIDQLLSVPSIRPGPMAGRLRKAVYSDRAGQYVNCRPSSQDQQLRFSFDFVRFVPSRHLRQRI